MNIIKAFNKAFKAKEENNWEKIYVLVDVHDTIMVGTKPEKEKPEWYYDALEVLKMMSDRDDICLIMWTGAYPDKISKYRKLLEEMYIRFDYVNENPEVENSNFYCMESKIYYNVGIDDRFGFEPETDWNLIKNFLKIKKI